MPPPIPPRPELYKKVDQEFYDQAKRANNGKLPPDLVGADGKPRKLTKSPADAAYVDEWKAIASKFRNSKAVVSKGVKVACVPCAAKAAAAQIPPILLPSKASGKPTAVQPVKRVPPPLPPRVPAKVHVPSPVGHSTSSAHPPPPPPPPPPKKKPCSLHSLTLAEPSISHFDERSGTRNVQVMVGAVRQRRVCPVNLPPGDTFQITAGSSYNRPRKITVGVVTDAVCGHDHPMLSTADSARSSVEKAASATLEFSRAPMFGENHGMMRGFWPVLNSVFNHGTVIYPLSVECCGIPAKPGDGVAALDVNIEIFPADQYSLELSLPAFLKPDWCKWEPQTSGWKKTKASEEAVGVYRGTDDLGGLGNEKEFKSFLADLKAKEAAEEEEKFPDGIELKLTQTDGGREYKAPVQDLIRLIRMIREAEYRLKQIQEWLENFQVGPGVSLKLEFQFFAGTLSAKWGYREYEDYRVFFAYSGSIKLDLIKASLAVKLGWRTAGLADLLVVLKGEGSISIAAEVAKKNPDEGSEKDVKPSGELKFTGALEGTLFWLIKGSVGLECAIKAETEEFYIFKEHRMFGGKVVFSREPTYAAFSYSNRIWGGDITKKVEVIKGNKNLHTIELD